MKLSKNFEDKEFYCPCKDCKKDKFPDGKLIILLQDLRDTIKKPIHISVGGGIRCISYNNRIGGYTSSPHLGGKASDICVKDFDYLKLAKLAKKIGFSRVGLNPYSYSKFIHVDIIKPNPNESWIRDGNGDYFYYLNLEKAIENIKKKEK